ncbi:ABC-three component system protein [Rhizobium leguminosarum]|uniref:ABC-three component system protein n=1 Tax=Rhizobium leguminosarum TaxID=384 RepID=UPI00102F7163|nr:ABC-three component system protein [Rhizobium leguminosarum]TAX29818.1 hypothetical protein ELI04_08620 [Rhizobium leguminosarum]
MVTKTELSIDDWFAVSRDAANVEHAGLYFIGTFDTRITFYSQQVRALRLAQALEEKGLIAANDRVAVIGSGAAGLTAALALAVIGRDVTLYDPAENILQLQSASPRLLHPHIYEWPKLGSLDDDAGIPLLNWSAGNGAVVCRSLKASFAAASARLPKLQFKRRHSLRAIDKIENGWRLTLDHNGACEQRDFQHVIFAMGFGDELPCGVSVPTDYWRPSGVGTAADEQHAGTRYLVSGSGDGGLTETLGLLVKDFEHLKFTREFLEMFPGDTLRAAAEQAFAGLGRGDDVEPTLEAHLLPLLKTAGILDRLEPRLRTDRTLTINAMGPLFEAGKAAQLNQCMVFAVLATASKMSIAVTRSAGRISDVKHAGQALQVEGIVADGNPVDATYKHVILRHGPNRKGRFGPIDAVFEAFKTYMSTLLQDRPELADPPVLDAETYDFFAKRAVDLLYDPVDRPARTAQLQQHGATIVIAVDKATHVTTERGASTLAVVADKCERLLTSFTIRIDALPKQVPFAADLLRISRASKGKIHIAAEDSVHAEWAALDAEILKASPEPSNFAPTPLIASSLPELVDACLIRLLDAMVTSAVAIQTCPTVGPIDPVLAVEISKTWSAWRAELEADSLLRAGFLRWLANVDQSKENSWDGSHADLKDFASALIMMVATHLGERLRPASSSHGNLEFAENGVALGSGCKFVGAEPIAEWTDPDQWGADALILSGSSEIQISDMPLGTISDGGTIANGVTQGKQIRPAVIQNNRQWRGRLAGPFDQWKAAVAEEFMMFRQRQDKELEEVTK